MDILPITIKQTVDILLENISIDEKSIIQNSTYEELLEFGIVESLNIEEITGIAMGNNALIEECSKFENDSGFITFLSVEQTIEVIVRNLILSIASSKS